MDERLEAQLVQRYTSEVLWHFVGRKNPDEPDKCFETLCSILIYGLKVGSYAEPFIYNDGKEQRNFQGWPVCCLSDIPLKDLHIHAIRYGTTAIGFHKSSAIKRGFNPVLYVHRNNSLLKYFMERRDFLEQYYIDKGETQSEAATKLDEILYVLQSITKQCDLLAPLQKSLDADAEQINNFYYEREWRSIWPWEFNANDVAIIIVNDDEQVDMLRNKFNTEKMRVNNNVPILPFRMVYRL